MVISASFISFDCKAQTGIGIYLPCEFTKPGFYYERYATGQIKVEGAYLWQDTIVCVTCYKEWSNSFSNYSVEHLMRVGEWKEYYEDGTLKSKGSYYGIHEVYGVHWPMRYGESSNGLVPGDAEIQYLKDKYWYYYNAAGNLIRLEYYYMGMLASIEVYKD